MVGCVVRIHDSICTFVLQAGGDIVPREGLLNMQQHEGVLAPRKPQTNSSSLNGHNKLGAFCYRVRGSAPLVVVVVVSTKFAFALAKWGVFVGWEASVMHPFH
uniref:Uncharacterized protein n=1 Tax=Anopheles farauti TaxID=69004 RepID=A0A182QC06_9DIPT